MENQTFDKDEIIPNGYESYESYLDDINEFLYKYQTVFTTKKYNSSQNSISEEDKSVPFLITKEYEKLPKEFITYFNTIKSYMNDHPEESKIIYEFLMDLSTDELPLIPSEYATQKNILKQKFIMPDELKDFITISRKLKPKDKSEECQIKDPSTGEWLEIKK